MRLRSFVFLRHGQTDWNLEGRIQGHTDIPLNATGRAQAAAAAARLVGAGVTRAVTSPLSRARETAEIVADHLGVPLEIDADLKERAFGAFEGRLLAEVKREHGIPSTQPVSTIMPPDAEQWPLTRVRTLGAIQKWFAAKADDGLLFVSHDGVFRALHEQLVGERPGSSNATPYRFIREEDRWRLEEWNPVRVDAAAAQAAL